MTKSRINLASGGWWGMLKFNICKDKYAKSIWKWQRASEKWTSKQASKRVSEWERDDEREEEHVPNINTSDIVYNEILLQSKATAAATTTITVAAAVATATAADKHHTPRLVWYIAYKTTLRRC